MRIVNCVHGGDHVAVHGHASGTHTGPFLGQPASGKPIDVQSLTLMRLEGNRLAEGWDSYDSAGPMAQIGVAGARAARSAGQGS
ncbi:MAG TPA: ester cyclase [Vicinamibacterales bacterium]